MPWTENISHTVMGVVAPAADTSSYSPGIGFKERGFVRHTLLFFEMLIFALSVGITLKAQSAFSNRITFITMEFTAVSDPTRYTGKSVNSV